MESDRDPLRKIPTKYAPEAKADIGSSLKAARVKKGASLDAVSQQTRISKRFLEALEANRPMVVEAACNKLAGSELVQRIAQAAVEHGAPEALVVGTQVEFLWRQTISETIGGGTSEVMRGVIARNGLGLAARR